jgi:hypothetical protein
MNKNSNNYKRYVSYEKPLKASQNNENYKNNFKKKESNSGNKKIVKTKNKFLNNISILYITNLLNNIYSCEIDNKINKINELHLGTKNLIFDNNNDNHKKDINFMFDSIFRYNYFHKNKNIIKPIKIKSNSKNKNKNNIKINNNTPNHFHEEIRKQQNEQKIISNNNIRNNLKNIENKNQNPNMNNIMNIKTNKKTLNQNTTLVLNKIDIDEEVISVNNKKKNHINLNINTNQINKKYSESRYITDSESGFILLASTFCKLFNTFISSEEIKEVSLSLIYLDSEYFLLSLLLSLFIIL